MQNRARPLSPTEWQAMLRDAQPSSVSKDDREKQPIVMDVRNDYEWDSGHFNAAARPLEVSLLRRHFTCLAFYQLISTSRRAS